LVQAKKGEPPAPEHPGRNKRSCAAPREEVCEGRAQEDALDRLAQHAAQLAPPALPPPAPPAAGAPLACAPAHAVAEARAHGSLEDLLPQLVRKVAWSGDGRRGAVRLELGVGSLAGATLLVQSEGGQVRVRLSAPPGLDADAWQARITERLAARGLSVDAVDVE
jgi:hypothetical protein